VENKMPSLYNANHDLIIYVFMLCVGCSRMRSPHFLLWFWSNHVFKVQIHQ